MDRGRHRVGRLTHRGAALQQQFVAQNESEAIHPFRCHKDRFGGSPVDAGADLSRETSAASIFLDCTPSLDTPHILEILLSARPRCFT